MKERPNTATELTVTFAACAALPRTCFRMSAAHHHVGPTRRGATARPESPLADVPTARRQVPSTGARAAVASG
jgi:hypothetical protein